MQLHPKRAIAALVSLVIVVPGVAIACTSLDVVRSATDKFHRVSVAKSHGYSRLKDTQGIACIDKAGEGGMGIHYVKPALVSDPAIDMNHPEAVIYDPGKKGRLRLVAVEYVVVKSDWDAHHSEPPSLFGRRFELVDSPNRYGLPPFYELHAWIWKKNPRGTFADYNPRVSC